MLLNRRLGTSETMDLFCWGDHLPWESRQAKINFSWALYYGIVRQKIRMAPTTAVSQVSGNVSVPVNGAWFFDAGVEAILTLSGKLVGMEITWSHEVDHTTSHKHKMAYQVRVRELGATRLCGKPLTFWISYPLKVRDVYGFRAYLEEWNLIKINN